MSPEMLQLVYAIGGAVVLAVAQRMGLKIPGTQPAPTPPPVPVPVPEADKPATDFLAWVLDVKAGKIKLDDHDRETLKLIRSSLEGVQ